VGSGLAAGGDGLLLDAGDQHAEGDEEHKCTTKRSQGEVPSRVGLRPPGTLSSRRGDCKHLRDISGPVGADSSVICVEIPPAKGLVLQP
jgi:hypothetical protein